MKRTYLRLILMAIVASTGPMWLIAWFWADGDVSGYTVINTLVFSGASYLSMLVHEIGHVLVALALGFGVISVDLGGGRGVRIADTTRFQLRIGWNPYEGRTVVVPRTDRSNPWRLWLVVAAGPVASAALVTLSATLGGSPTQLTRTANTELAPMSILLATNALVLLVSLVPRRSRIWATDGHLLMVIPFYGKRIINQLGGMSFVMRGQQARRRGQLDSAIECYRRGLDLFGDVAGLRLALSATLWAKGQDVEASTQLRQIIQEKPDELLVARAWAVLSLIAVATSDSSTLHEAHTVVERVFDEFRFDEYVRTAWGALCIHDGETHRGVKLLQDVFDGGETEHVVATSAFWLGVVAKEQGHHGLVEYYNDVTGKLDPQSPWLNYVK